MLITPLQQRVLAQPRRLGVRSLAHLPLSSRNLGPTATSAAHELISQAAMTAMTVMTVMIGRSNSVL